MAYRVFVSHATSDKWIATTLCEKIDAAGATSFRDDRDIAGGDDIPEAIRAGLLGSDELLVLLTPESVGRAWVLMEVGAARLRGDAMRIIGVRCHVEIDPIPAMLKTKKLYSINDFDRYLGELARRVASPPRGKADGKRRAK